MKKFICLLISAVFFIFCFNAGVKTCKENHKLWFSLQVNNSCGTSEGLITKNEFANKNFVIDKDKNIRFYFDSNLEKGYLNFEIISDEGKVLWNEKGTDISKNKLLKLPKGNYCLKCVGYNFRQGDVTINALAQ